MNAPAPNPDPALLDRVTGLANRRALLRDLRERVPDGQGALVMLDLDGFRPATERFPRALVERLLLEVARRLSAAADPEAVLYRWAADAFCALVPGADKERGARCAETLRAAVGARPFALGADTDGLSVALTASASASAYPVDGRSPTLLIEAAELALLVAKRQGRDGVAVAGRLNPAVLAEIGVFRGLPCPLLIGRAPEQAKLRQMASDARHVGASCALLTGPPGLGKSRLLRELASWARSERFVVLSTLCREPRSGFPYASLAEAVDGLSVTDPRVVREALLRLDPERRGALAVVLREYPLPDPPAKIELSRYARLLWEAFPAFLEELARKGPLLVALDEVEHADAATFEALRQAAARGVPYLLAAATDLDADAFARTRAGDFFRERGPSAVTLQLGPLTPEEMGRMLQAILPDADFAPDTARRLIESSGGNPLWLEETLRSLLLKGRVRLEGGRWRIPTLGPEDLPADLDGAVRAVAGALPARANTLLLGAAVIGAQVDPDLLQEVMGQDDMEMLDLIDEARRARLLVTSDTETELLSFPASYARRARLESSPDNERQQLHARVGVAQEARHGGNVAHLADELAFHYGRAGREDRARHFETVARARAELLRPPRREGARRARLEPCKEPLSPAALEHALAALRHFAGALKVGRLYPQWSQVSAGFVAQLREELRALLAAAPGFTFSATSAGPAINGRPSDASVAADFAALLDERLVESLTLRPSFEVGRIETVLKAFTEPFDRVRAEADHWDRFLDREGLEGIDLVQKAYQVRERAARAAARSAEGPIPPEHLPALRDALRLFKAAVDALKLYPPGHSLVEETAREASRALTELGARVPIIVLGTAEGELVVNGRPGDRKFYGEAGAFLVKEIDERGLKSVTLASGLTEDEVRALVSFLSMPPGTPAAALLQQFVHVEFGSREYARAEEGGTVVSLAPPPRPIRSEIRARELLAKPYAEFLSGELEQQFPALVETLAYGALRPLAEQLVDRLGAHFADPSGRHRRRAFDLLGRSLAFASPGTRRLEVERSAPPLRQRLWEDKTPELFRTATDILPLWIPAAATVGCLRELAEIACSVLRKRAGAPDTPQEIAIACESILQEIPKTSAYPVLLASLRKPRPEERMTAASILLSIGGEAVRRLLEAFLDEPDPAARRAMATALGFAAAEAAAELAHVLGPETPPDRMARLLEAIDPLLGPALASLLAELAEKGSPEVRRMILEAAERWPASLAAPVARQLLGSADEARRVRGLELAARLKIPQLGPEVGRLMEATEDERLLRLCSAYFEAAPNPAAVPLLARILERRPRFLGLVKGYSAETRRAALAALARQGTRQAEEALRAVAARDREMRELAEALAAEAKPPTAAPPARKPF
jgi:diguanylate cyclase (GGDEF)-like protein